MKTYERHEIKSQKIEIAQWKNDKQKIDEESLKLYCLVKKSKRKPINLICNFDELKWEKSLNINK